jgi:hypothetical protein
MAAADPSNRLSHDDLLDGLTAAASSDLCAKREELEPVGHDGRSINRGEAATRSTARLTDSSHS